MKFIRLWRYAKGWKKKEYEYFTDKLIYEIGTTENCGHGCL